MKGKTRNTRSGERLGIARVEYSVLLPETIEEAIARYGEDKCLEMISGWLEYQATLEIITSIRQNALR